MHALYFSFQVTMAKMLKLVDPLQPETSTHSLTTDCNKCALCQEDTTEVLLCPAESRRDMLCFVGLVCT
jgi:hypothetical protein